MEPNDSNASPLLTRIIRRTNSKSSLTGILLRSTFVAVSGSFVFGCVVGFSSPAQSGILKDLQLSLAAYSLFGSLSNIGAVIGAILSRKIADFLGRRGAMGFAELFNIVGWLSIAFSEDALLLDIGRLSTGFGIGLLSYMVPVYIAEISPKNLRGAFTALNQLMICCGISVMYLLGNLIAWRLLAIIGTIPCMIQLIGVFIIPESPRWLAKVGNWGGSVSSLTRLRGKKTDVFEEAAEIKDHTSAQEQLESSRLVDLFQRKYARSVTVGVGLMVLQQFGGVNAIAFYADAIFSSAGFSAKVGTTSIAVLQIPMTLLGTLLMDKSGRRPLLLVSASGTCLGCFLIALSFFLQELKLWDSSPFLALAGVLIFKGSFSVGMGAVPWVIMSEIFPMNVKGLAGSLVSMVNWLCSWIITYSFIFLELWSSSGTFFIFSFISGFTVLFVTKLVPETKGRTLEEIEGLFTTSSSSDN